jgi:arylsulfatase A-like enzyme
VNIVLIVIDTVRKDYLPPFGRRGFPAPHIERFAEGAVLYDRVISPAPWTTPVHASIFTGLYPSEHGTHGGRLELDADAVQGSFVSRLRRKGYRCVGITTNYLVSEPFGFSAPFDRFLQAWQAVSQAHADYHFDRKSFQALGRAGKAGVLLRDLVRPGRCGQVVRSLLNRRYGRRHFIIEDATHSTRRALRWAGRTVRQGGDAPFFLFINLMQAHDRYNPPSGIRDELGLGDERYTLDSWRYYAGLEEVGPEEFARLSALYAGEIYFLDRCLGGFLDELRSSPSWDDTLVAIVSDHGELLGEHGLLGHLTGLFSELIDVPLIVRYPRGVAGPGVDDRLRQSHDLFATILELTGAGAVPEGGTVSLLDPGGRTEAVSQLVSNRFILDEVRRQGGELREDLVPFARPMMALIRDGWKYVVSDRGEEWLFDLGADPGEGENRIDDPRRAGVAAEMRAAMRRAAERTGFGGGDTASPLEGAVVERLRAMGYI